jgi:hypothetical protein
VSPVVAGIVNSECTTVACVFIKDVLTVATCCEILCVVLLETDAVPYMR